MGRRLGTGPRMPEPEDEGETDEGADDTGATGGDDPDPEVEDPPEEEPETPKPEDEPETPKPKPKAPPKPKGLSAAAQQKATKRAVDKALREDRAAREAEAATAAERASMDETQRLTAERDEARADAKKYKTQSESHGAELLLAQAIAASDHRLVASDDQSHVNQLVQRVMNADGLDEHAALAAVAENSPHLFKQGDSTEAKPKAKPKKATTTGGPRSGTTKPDPTPTKVDALAMPKKEYDKALNELLAGGTTG